MLLSHNITSDEPLIEGRAFGATGGYRIVFARACGELDPQDAALSALRGLDAIPRNARGRIEYETDIVVLRPQDPSRGNGRLLYEVNNRGRKQIFRFLCDAPTTGGALAELSDIGNGFVLERGFTVAWSGWDPTAPTVDAGLALKAPLFEEHGRPMVRMIRDEFATGTTHGAPDRDPLPPDCFRLAYPAADRDPSRAQLSTRRWPGDAPTPIPASDWEYFGDRAIRLRRGPPVPGLIHDFRYPATDAPAIGLGFAATRDVVSYLRHAPQGAALTGREPTHALALGVSQAGRYLRDHLGRGFNRDEAGRRVFDGMLIHVAGAGRVFAHEPFATPFRTRYAHQDHDFPEVEFPFSAARLEDPVGVTTAALMQGDASDPKLMDSNTSSEYWKKAASLLHTDPLGTRDVELPDNARAYLIAGTSHDGRPFMDGQRGPCRHPTNPHDPSPVLRALLVALDEWVAEGTLPPASATPLLADNTLRAATDIGFPVMPGLSPPAEANDAEPTRDWVNPPAPTRRHRTLVCRVDADGNEVAGIRTPDIAAPLGTHTGWNFFGEPASVAIGERIVADKHGAFIPFAADLRARHDAGDTRASIDERYRDHADYVEHVRTAAQALVRARLLLPADAERYVARARERKLFNTP
jgi:hypothetical protein